MSQGPRELERHLDALYAADPAGFTRARDALVKKLKAEGDDDEAARVGKLRKPTQIAWVLNTLAQRHPEAIAELVDVGRGLAREHRKVARGETASALSDLMKRQREVVADVTQRTATLMKELGVEPLGHLDEIAVALRAAMTDPAVGQQLEEGRLDKAPGAVTSMSLEDLLSASAAPTRRDEAAEPRKRRGAPERARPTAKAKATTRATAAEKKRAATEARRLEASRKREAAAEERRREAARKRDAAAKKREATAHRKAVAALTVRLKAAEQKARKQADAAERARAEAADADARARRLEAAAEASARAAAEARAALDRA